MKRIVIILLAAVLICLCSCELAVKAPGPGRMHILVYGNDYKYGSAVYYEDGRQAGSAGALKGTVNDAYQVGLALTTLAAKAGYEYDGIFLLGKESRSVTDPNITVVNNVYKSEFVGILEAMAANYSESDITIIYYSGHGLGETEKLPYGSDPSQDSYLALRRDLNSSILYPISCFMDRVDAIPGIKVVLGDFCHSGAMVRQGNVSVTSGEYYGIDASTLLSRYGNAITESPSVFCLSAARYYERSYEPGGGRHGYFTEALLKALGWDEENSRLTTPGALNGNRLTLFDIARYVTDHDSNAKQTPMTSGGSNDIILFSF
ncbi:MAG: caspase family protein [Spirochaetales bacterium]|nr:caspase family protein [Spirochaetales bacterium]